MRLTSTWSVGLVAGLISAFAACRGTGPGPEHPTPQPVDTRQCIIEDNANWNTYFPELDYHMVQSGSSLRCPYLVANAEDLIGLNVVFEVSPTQNPKTWYYTTHEIRNNQNTLKTPAIGQSGSFDSFYSLGGGYLEAEILTWYEGGTGSYPFEDEARIEVAHGNAPYVFPWVTISLPGRIEGYAPLIAGSTYVVSGYPVSWSVDTSEPALSYTYRWFVNGTPVSGQTTQYFTTTLTPGSHTVKMEATRSDGSIVTDEKNITAVNCGGPDIC